MSKINLQVSILKDENQSGIWQYSSYLHPVEDRFKLSLGEGETKEVVREEIIYKREDLNPSGSLKDRGMAYLISKAHSLGFDNFVLSSSGNAAISALKYCRLAKLKLTVFVSPKIKNDYQKHQKLLSFAGEIVYSLNPVSESMKFAKKNQEKRIFNLRPSINEFGSEGYQTIAFELLKNQGLIQDIFIPVSSGVALLGIANGFKKFGFLPRFHLCQSSAVCSLAKLFDNDFKPEEESLTTSLVAKTTPLKNDLLSIIRGSQGSGWVIGNDEISEAQTSLEKDEIITSAEGALALAAITKAKNNHWLLGKTVCLLTGRKY